MRVRMAASDAPKVTAGRTRCPTLPDPETGNSPRRMAKNNIKIGPSAKFGKDSPQRLTKLSRRSSQRLRLRAERTPAGMEISKATIIAARVSWIVDGYRLRTTDDTG